MKEGFWHLCNLIKDQIKEIDKFKKPKEQILEEIIFNNESLHMNSDTEKEKKRLFRKINNFLIN